MTNIIMFIGFSILVALLLYRNIVLTEILINLIEELIKKQK